jgi:hypothetical protein
MKFFATLPLLAISTFSLGAHQDKMMDSMNKNMFGGPVYQGDPALAVTASLVQAGGGADSFSIKTALVDMVGGDTVTAEVGKLTKKYGATRVTRFINVFDFAVKDALKIATAAGVTLPSPTLDGKDLASTLVKAGQDEKGVFWTGYLLDKAVTHKIHMQVMLDIDKQFGADADKDYHRISNQTHYDLAKALGVSGVKLAPLH